MTRSCSYVQCSVRRLLLACVVVALTIGAAQGAIFQVSSTADSGAGTLREAIEAANDAVGPATIDLSPIAGDTITLESSLPEIVIDLVVQGSDVTLDGAGQHTCFAARAADLSIDSMTITRCGGHFRLANDDNGIEYIEHRGGAIWVDLGDLTLTNATVLDNAAPEDTATERFALRGGGVFVSGAEHVSITNSIIQGNAADEGAGGIHIESASQTITITATLVEGNASSGEPVGGPLSAGDSESAVGAGGVYARVLDGTIAISDTTIRGNAGQGAAFGGAVVSAPLGTSIERSAISSNTSENAGGGLLVLGGLRLDDTTISDNSGAGGGLMHFDFTLGSNSALLEMSNATLSGNSSSGQGGGALLYSHEGDIVIGSSTISGNSAQSAAGLAVTGIRAAQVELDSVTITGNHATAGAGGGLWVTLSDPLPDPPPNPIPDPITMTVAVSRSIISGNLAVAGGADLGADSARGNIRFEVDLGLVGEVPNDDSEFVPDPVTSDLLGADPQLGPLAANGGLTLTHLPGLGSPALDVISAAGGCGSSFVIDQRGQTRPDPFSDLCDAGSVERQGVPELVVTLPGGLEFGDVSVGESVEREITLSNEGDESGEVSGLNNLVAPFSIAGGSCSGPPYVLARGVACTLILAFSPTGVGDFDLPLNLAIDDGSGGSTVLAINGRGLFLIEPIPTLGDYGLLMAAILLALLGMFGLRRRHDRESDVS